MIPRVSIVVCSDDLRLRDELAALLTGLPQPLITTTTAGLASQLSPPALLLVDLRGANEPSQLLRECAAAECQVVALIDPATDTSTPLLEVGASDCINVPFSAAAFLLRVHQHLAYYKRVLGLRHREALLSMVVQLTEQIASNIGVRAVLIDWARRLQAATGARRAEIFLLRSNRQFAFALTSTTASLDSDIELSRRPPLDSCVRALQPFLVEDARSHPLTSQAFAEGELDFASCCVAPISDGPEALGLILLEADQVGLFDSTLASLLGTLGHVAGHALRNARLLRSLQAETRQSAEAREHAERRLRHFAPYAEFFNNSADGMVVIEPDGRLLYANPSARALVPGDPRFGNPNIVELLPAEERERARSFEGGFRAGVYPKGQDFRVGTPSGERIVSVNFSSALRDAGAVLVTFRDVTKERQTERQLLQTKEFLERVIDSSVDAIVSADLKGRVLLYNHAAARIFGYPAEQVLAGMNVEQLYPPGVARQVMRKIRSPALGGEDRLVDYQVDMQDCHGNAIATKLSAALIYDGEVPTGSVGIFTDIREQLLLAERLHEAEQELRRQEKDVAVAQLAGATAHELNQPLTSVITYAELLLRKSKPDPTLEEAAGVIVDQAERMAEIVRRIGALTRYETKSYVGGSQIVDLDKSTGRE